MKDAGFHGLWIGAIILTIVGFASKYPLIGVISLFYLVVIVCGYLGAKQE